MTTIGGELSDLLILLAIVCVPLAVGSVCIPVGRAIADRIRNAGEDDVMLRRLWLLESRLESLEHAVAVTVNTTERLGHHEGIGDLPIVPRVAQGLAAPPQVITPH